MDARPADPVEIKDRGLVNFAGMGENVDMRDSPRKVRLPGGRYVTATNIFDTYWRFAYKRQEVFMARVADTRPPWTNDPVLLEYRFTNAYRASDRVSQYLIRNVIYADGASQAPADVVFRTLLFKFFNRIDTWEWLVARVGLPCLGDFSERRYAAALEKRLGEGISIYSAAYIMPSPPFGHARKHKNHLALLRAMMSDHVEERLASAATMRDAFKVLRRYPSLGDFLAFQFLIDINYSDVLRFEESEFAVAGPGAIDGIAKCFEDTGALPITDLLIAVAEIAEEEFNRLDLPFKTLWGRRLQPIDCQNLFCEVDKYSRVVHPESKGRSGRVRIKQRFRPQNEPLLQFYPPKWNVHPTVTVTRSTSAPLQL